VVDAPTITDLEPSSVALGDPDVDLHVTGTGFTEISCIVFDGHDEPTKLISETEVSTGVKPSLFTEAKDIGVAVRNGSMISSTLPFTFTASGTRSASRRKRD
jgi:hypothetical protein